MKDINKKISLILEQVLSIYSKDSLSDALSFVDSSLEKDVAQRSELLALVLNNFAKSIYFQDPASVIEILLKSIQYNNNLISSWLLLGVVYDQFGKHQLSKEALLRVVESEISLPREKIEASNLLVRLGLDSLAHEVSKKAYYQLEDKSQDIEAVIYIALKVADWDFVDEITKEISQAYARGEFAKVGESPRTNLLWCANEEYNINVVWNWSRKTFPILSDAKRISPKQLGKRKIKVAYLSSDFREHPTARLINGLLRNHDKSKFELYMYCSGWEDGSAMRKEVISHFDFVYSVTNMSDVEASELIKNHEIDILVELNGPTRANRMGVLTHKPAPIQIDYIGWPGSIGGRMVDYIVGDCYTVPNNIMSKYPEKVIRINDIYQINDYACMKLPSAPTKAEVNLPKDVLVLGMFNAINKVRNEVWNTWMKIMQRVPNSVLWLLEPGEVARRFILQKSSKMGIDTKRIIIAPKATQEEHLARIQLCDLMLDPWPYGGHTSTSDALFVGVPVVAMQGENFAGRVSGGLLKAANLEMLICQNVKDYIEKTVELLQDKNKLVTLKQIIKTQVPKSNIFDATSKTRELERAYETIIDRAINNLPSLNIDMQKIPSSFVITNNLALREKLTKLIDILLLNGSHIDKDIKVYYDNEGLSIHSISKDFSFKKNIEIPTKLLPILSEYDFYIDDDMLICKAKKSQKNTLQKELMFLMVDVYNLTSKISFHKESNIFYNLKNHIEFLELLLLPIQTPKIKKYLSYLDSTQYETLLIESFFATRVYSLQSKNSSKNTLLPLLDYLNHKVLGKGFQENKNSIYVENAPTNDSTELFVSYNYYDALETLTYYGFVDISSPLYFSIPMKILLNNGITLEIQNIGFKKLENEDAPEGLSHLKDIIPLITKKNDKSISISKLLIPNIQLPFALRKFLHLVLNELGIEQNEALKSTLIEEIEKKMLLTNIVHYEKLAKMLSSIKADTQISDFTYNQLKTLIEHNLEHLNNYGVWLKK